jgi:inner membrane transporter RhtA
MTVWAIPAPAARRGAVERVPPHAWFVLSATGRYLGGAFAVLLFARVDPLGVTWLRCAWAALVLLLWRGSPRRLVALVRTHGRLLAGWGLTIVAMNLCFFEAVSRLPLGTVAPIEFVGVLGVALAGTRTRRNLLALACAFGGVYLLTGAHLAGEPVGIAFAFAETGFYVVYIVLGHRVAHTPTLAPMDGLAVAVLVAALAITAPMLAGSTAALQPVALAAGLGVALASTAIPYVCDQLAMARLSRATFALLVSLQPAIATAIGLVVLAQVPRPVDLAGIALVIVGVAIHRERSAVLA